MNDPRVTWMQTKIFEGLQMAPDQADRFEDFLDRDHEKEGRKLMKFLNETPEEDESFLIFYKMIRREDREILVEYGKRLLSVMMLSPVYKRAKVTNLVKTSRSLSLCLSLSVSLILLLLLLSLSLYLLLLFVFFFFFFFFLLLLLFFVFFFFFHYCCYGFVVFFPTLPPRSLCTCANV